MITPVGVVDSSVGSVPYSGLLGVALILLVAYALSNNRKAIHWRLVVSGLALQTMLAVFILKMPLGQRLFALLGQGIERLLSFADAGGGFVFGPLVSQPATLGKLFGPGGAFIFAFKIVPSIIFVATLVAMAYHLGIMQKLIRALAWVVYRLLGASGAEALSNTASVFVGQIEAQLLIKPYVASLTMSELLTVMAGSMACIAGGVMAVYIQMGIPAQYLIAASLMAIPGALVIAKMMYPETETSFTRGDVQLSVETPGVNLIDAAAHGASDGLRIGLSVCAMLIAFVALVALADAIIGQLGLTLYGWGLDGTFLGLSLQHLTLGKLLGVVFSGVALLLGVPLQDAQTVGSLMGTKLVLNEFVAYTELAPMLAKQTLAPISALIATFALCGFANLGSVAIQVGGIGEMAPSRKADLAKLGLKAMVCGSMASYLSGALAGVMVTLPQAQASSGDWLPVALMLAALVLLLGANRYLKTPSFG